MKKFGKNSNIKKKRLKFSKKKLNLKNILCKI